MERPAYLEQGERARLFPVLSDSSKEGRATSIFLACLANVDEYANQLLASVGRPIGQQSTVRTYTEVCFAKDSDEMRGRPDGLIDVKTGRASWSALVEAKIGTADLSEKQIEGYLKIAKANGLDAVITISNEFAPSPQHHPVTISNRGLQKIALFHWSWMHLLTQADLLLANDGVADREQKVILNELRRFLSHPSTGVKGFDRMPPEWPELVTSVAAGGSISATSKMLKIVLSAWHQELRDLCLILSRQLTVPVDVKMSTAASKDADMRLTADAARFIKEQTLQACLVIPEAATNLDITVDVRSRVICAGMRLAAPEDKKGTTARVNWLLRQIADAKEDDIFVRLHWPRRAPTQHTLKELRKDSSVAANSHSDIVTSALEILFVKRTGPRFGQVKNFIDDLESVVPEFYKNIGGRLKAWQPAAPKVRNDRSDAQDVTTDAIAEDAEDEISKIEKASKEKSGFGFWKK